MKLRMGVMWTASLELEIHFGDHLVRTLQQCWEVLDGWKEQAQSGVESARWNVYASSLNSAGLCPELCGSAPCW